MANQDHISLRRKHNPDLFARLAAAANRRDWSPKPLARLATQLLVERLTQDERQAQRRADRQRPKRYTVHTKPIPTTMETTG